MFLAAAAVIAIGSFVARAMEKAVMVGPGGGSSVTEQMVDPGFLDAVLASFVKVFVGPLMDNTAFYAFSLFKILIMLDFIVAVIMALLAFENSPNFLTLLFNKIFKYGFWLWIIGHWGYITDTIIKSLTQVGVLSNAVVPSDIMMHPSLMITMGYDLSSSYLEYMADWNGGTDWLIITFIFRVIVAFLAAILIFVAFALIALNMFLTTVEYYLCVGLMLIFIPFAVFDRTEKYASQSFSLCVSAGTRMMVFSVLVSMTYAFFDQSQPGSKAMKEIFTIKGDAPSMTMAMFCIILALAIAYLCCEAPQMAASVIQGALHLDSNNAIMHGYGAAHIAGKGINAAANMVGTAYGAGQRGVDSFKAAKAANEAAVAAGGKPTASPLGAGLKGFGKGVLSGMVESSFGGMEEAKRVTKAASGRETSNVSSEGLKSPGYQVTKNADGDIVSAKPVNNYSGVNPPDNQSGGEPSKNDSTPSSAGGGGDNNGGGQHFKGTDGLNNINQAGQSGKDGKDGAKGDKGDKGSDGMQGMQGAQGQRGSDAGKQSSQEGSRGPVGDFGHK